MTERSQELLIGGTGLLLGVAGMLYFWQRQVQRPAKGNPAELLRQGIVPAPGRRVVVCLGASIVAGRVSVDFVDILRSRCAGNGVPQINTAGGPAAAEPYIFVNAGVNGDLAYDALARLDTVIACDPDAVVILVGTNDVQCTLSERLRRLMMRGKRLPTTPDAGWYRANITEIVTRLKQETRAGVALCSLPVLGENLSSPANQCVREFNAILKQIAEEQESAYLPVHELQEEYLVAQCGAQGLPYKDTPLLVMTAAMRHYLLGQTFDTIAERSGLLLTTDRIHMNSQGAAIIVDLVADFLQHTL